MFGNPRRLRQPEERVGKCSNVALPPPAVSPVDDALVQRIRAHDESAVRMLHERYARTLHNLALQFVHRHEDAEEVVQETWMAALSGIHRFQGRSSLKTWLCSILVNRARSKAKRDARTIPFSALSSAEHARVEEGASHTGPNRLVAAPQPPADHLALDNELNGLLTRAIASLPAIQRHVITLRDVEGWTADEVCQTLRISDSNQRVVLHRARMKIRSALIPYIRTGSLTPG
jgi:RNA polymerase sigma-70 factor (ECF subfamily)